MEHLERGQINVRNIVQVVNEVKFTFFLAMLVFVGILSKPNVAEYLNVQNEEKTET